MKKRILLPMLAALIVLSLIMSACGGSETSGEDNDSSTGAGDLTSPAEGSENSEVSYMIKDSYTTDELRAMDIDELVAVIYANGYVPPENNVYTEEEKRECTRDYLQNHRDDMMDWLESEHRMYPYTAFYSYDYAIDILQSAYRVIRTVAGYGGPDELTPDSSPAEVS